MFETICDNILPVYSVDLLTKNGSFFIKDDPPSPSEQELKDLKESLQDTQPVGVLVNCCKTLDQVSLAAQLQFPLAIIYKIQNYLC